MHRLRCALGLVLQKTYEKYKLALPAQQIAVNMLLPSLVPSFVFFAASPKVQISNPCSPSPSSNSNLGDTSKSVDLALPPPEKPEEPIYKSDFRPFYVAGNLKMFVTKADIDEIVKRIKKSKLDPNVEIVLVTPIVYIQHAKSILPKKITIAAPNCHHEGKGPFTGEVSPLMVKEVGAQWVVVGQSERRKNFGENDEVIGQKICRALYDGLKVIVCVGENLEERESDADSFATLHKQLTIIAGHVKDQWHNVVIAYQPTWACATGKKCSPEDAQEAHDFIREWLEANISPDTSMNTRIIYGGKVVNGEDAKLYAKEEDIDGFLVGCSSNKPEFIDIVNVIQNTNKEIEAKEKAREKELAAKKKK